MNRREFLRSAGIVSLGLAGRRGVRAAARDGWRSFTIATRVEVLKPSGMTRVWLPAALIIDTPYQKTLANDVVAPGATPRLVESKEDALGIVCVELPAGVQPIVTLTSRVSTHNHLVDLGASSQTITKSQHCRAEVFLTGHGWVPVDPADVRKVVLEEPPGPRRLDDEMVMKARARLFGSWEMNWIAFNFAHDVTWPGSMHAPLGFLMYPQAETSDGRLDSLDPDRFGYEITSHETVARDQTPTASQLALQ